MLRLHVISYPCLRPYATSKLDNRSERCIFLGYSAFHHGYRCLSLTSGRIYISRDVIFQENIYPFKDQPEIINQEINHSPSILGSFPTGQPSHPPTNLSSSASTSSEQLEKDQPSFTSDHGNAAPTFSKAHDSLPVASEDSNSSPTSSSNDNQSDSSHIPSTDPLSPSNLDNSSSNSNIKTRRLLDIFKSIDSVNSSHTTKFPLPTCLHVSSYVPSEPVNVASAIKQPEWLKAMEEEIAALTHNNTWTLVPGPHNRPVIGCKWITKTNPHLMEFLTNTKHVLWPKAFFKKAALITMKHSVQLSKQLQFDSY